MRNSYEVIIIGAGTAGLAALREVRRQTEDVLIVNAGSYGTTCARVGCMPSKALIESANAYHHSRNLEQFGVGSAAADPDVPAVLRRVRRLRDEFVAGIVPLTQSLGDRSVSGRARFLEPEVIEIEGRRVRARAFILATGSTPIVPKSWRALGKRVLTSDDLFEQMSLPARMAVIGLGAVGAEIAQALARLGVQVVAVAKGAAIGGLTDPLVNAAALNALAQEFKLVTERSAELAAQDDGVRVRTADMDLQVGAVLAALGRIPNVSDLGLERLGIALDENGAPQFDRHTMQIGTLPIFIAGDATAAFPVLHEASDAGYIAGWNALRNVPTRFQRRTPLGIIFTDPNIAIVGKRFSDLGNEETAIGSVDFSRQGRARMAAENRGVLRLYARKADGRLLGAELCAPRGEHLAHLLALALEQRMTVHDLLRMPFYHPVFEEGLRTALRDASRQLQVDHVSDLASCGAVGADALD